MRPDDFTLFSQYHLGLLPDGKPQFSNIGDIARRYATGVEQVQAWLVEGKIDAATADDTDYDLPGQHAEAQVLAMLGDTAATAEFARKVYAEYPRGSGTSACARSPTTWMTRPCRQGRSLGHSAKALAAQDRDAGLARLDGIVAVAEVARGEAEDREALEDARGRMRAGQDAGGDVGLILEVVADEQRAAGGDAGLEEVREVRGFVGGGDVDESSVRTKS